MPQTDFLAPSSQRYISEVERQLKVPSLAKVEELAESLSVHPLTMLAYAYLKRREIDSLHILMEMIEGELKELELVGPSGTPAARPERLRQGRKKQ